MAILGDLAAIYQQSAEPFLLHGDRALTFQQVRDTHSDNLIGIKAGDVVALIGDFEPASIRTLLKLFDLGAIVVPLTRDTRSHHEYFFDAADVDVVIEAGTVRRRRDAWLAHPMLDFLRAKCHPGLVLFSSGTTGRPEAILHNFDNFLVRFRTPRPAFRTLNFLLFDHIGGINTLLHTLYNRGVVVIPKARTPEQVLADIAAHRVELLPTTPSFLRMMLMSSRLLENVPDCLKVVTYGTERMDQVTLDQLAQLLPGVDFRQTYGMSELGILRIKSRARDSLWIRVGGEGVQTRVVNGVLHIRAEHRMLGYLNAPSPFDEEGWYNTQDLVEVDGKWVKIIGRTSDTISVGGIKVLPSEVERAVLLHPEVVLARACGVDNPITGQHIELTCELRPQSMATVRDLREHLRHHLAEAVRPHRIRIGKVALGHRFKRR